MKHKSISKHTVSRETFSATDSLIDQYREELETFLDRLLWWNDRINLVSRNVSRETIWEHIRHSVLLSQLDGLESSQKILDSGTGGGLPGLPLAIAHPQKSFVLNDIVSKKCIAVKQIVRKLGLTNVDVLDGSIADIHQNAPFLLISKHAFKINDLYEMASHLPWTKMVFYKGDDYDTELEQMDQPVSVSTHSLSEGGAFYKGKSIVIVEKR